MKASPLQRLSAPLTMTLAALVALPAPHALAESSDAIELDSDTGEQAAVPVRSEEPGPEEPVHVLSLTDTTGQVTGSATAGLEAVEAELTTTGAVNTDDVALLTAPIDVEHFMVAGLSWDGAEDALSEAHALVRVREEDGWTPWLPTCTCAACTGAFITSGATAVQLQINAEELPADLELALIPGNPAQEHIEVMDPSEAQDVPDSDPLADPERHLSTEVGTQADVSSGSQHSDEPVPQTGTDGTGVQSQDFATQAATPPDIISRAEWGADEANTTWNPHLLDLQAATVHHTAGTNTYGPEQSASIVRAIWHYHRYGRVWGDIGYNFLIDRFGQVFEGRKGTLAAQPGEMVVAAHAGGNAALGINYNRRTMGVSVMGDFTGGHPPEVAYQRLEELIAWQFHMAGVDATTQVYLENRTLPRIFGHRDVQSTTCPGVHIQSRLPALRSAVQERVSAVLPAFTDVPVDHKFAEEISWIAEQGIASGYDDGSFRPLEVVHRGAMAAFLRRSAGATAPEPTDRFSDVPASYQFAGDIEWLVRHGIASGHDDGTFRPGEPVARSAVAAFLYRMAGRPNVSLPAQSPFSDVGTDHPFYREIIWLSQTGITTGDPNGTFRPGRAVNREAMAAFLYRFDQGDHGYAAGFTDIPVGHEFFQEIAWMGNSGITSGYTEGGRSVFQPRQHVSREATAAFLYRYADGQPSGNTGTFPDVPAGHKFATEIEWLVAEGIAEGHGDGTFRPLETVQRQAIAAFLYRMAGSPPVELPETTPFTDVPSDHQFYREIIWLADSGITSGYVDGSFRPRAPIQRQAIAAFLYRFDRVG